jgi:hypothetical protein
MIKALLTILVKLVEAKLEKAGVETLVLKNQNYITVAKQVWREVDETFRISTTIQEKLLSKAAEFEKRILARFPELSKSDIDSLRLAIGGEINVSKAAVLDNSTILQELQATNTSLVAENESLKNQLKQVQSLVIPTVNTDQQATA